MTRPLIGITSYVEPASWSIWHEVPAVLVPHRYVRQVQGAGGTAVVIPPLPRGADETDVATVLSRLDGLILAGGSDVEPVHYGQQPHAVLQPPRPDRDESELKLVRASARADLPVLGICRGMQVMAVGAGGSLEQHLPDRVGHFGHSPAPGTYGEHPVELQPGTRVHDILGDQVTVATYHHQGVVEHPGYRAAGWSVDDHVLESFEDPDARFRIGVQWHPEVGSDPRLFEALVAAAAG
jgi:putative glutamine amidotransferase